MTQIAQIAAEHESSVIENGNPLPVPFGDKTAVNAGAIDADGDSTFWIPCAEMATGSMFVDPGATGSTITVEGRRTTTAPAEDIVAAGAIADAGAAVMDVTSIEGFSHMRVLSDGTNLEVTLFFLLLRAG